MNGGGRFLYLNMNTFNNNWRSLNVNSTSAEINNCTIQKTGGHTGINLQGLTSIGDIYNVDVLGNGSLYRGIQFISYCENVAVRSSEISGCSESCVYNQNGSEGIVSANNIIRRNGQYSIKNYNAGYQFNATNNTWYSMLNYGSVNTTGGTFYKKSIAMTEDEKIFEDAVKYYNNGDIQTALLLFKDLLVNYSESEYAKKSFYYIMLVFEDFDKNGMNEAPQMRGQNFKENYDQEKAGFKKLRSDALDYFIDVKKALKPDTPILDRVEVHLLYWLERNDKLSETEAQYDKLIASDIPEELKEGLIFNKALFYIHRKDNVADAVALLQELANKNSDISESARDKLIALGYGEKPTPPDAPERAQPFEEKSLLIYDNYPNPFNPITTFSFRLAETGHVVLKVYDIRGREVVTLIDREVQKGDHEQVWDGKDSRNVPAASGLYFCQITYQDKVYTKKIALTK
jgi:hypothetical protein